MDNDVWREVEEARSYEVSRNGRIRNKKTGRILKPQENNHTGKPQVTLMDNGYRITRMVHCIVERAFHY